MKSSANKGLRTVLYAEDDPDDRMLMQEAVVKAGMECDLRLVEDGRELLDYLRRTGRYASEEAPRPDLILLDLNMPRMDGFDALAEIKTHSELWFIPVIVLTSSRSEADVFRAFKSGATSYVEKPNSFEELVEAMEGFRKWWLESVSLLQPFGATPPES